MRMLVPDELITFSPSTNQIILAPPFDQVIDREISFIRDVTAGNIVLYDQKNPYSPGILVSNANSVCTITYTHDNKNQLSTDKLQVELEYGFLTSRQVVFSSQAVVAGGTATQATKLFVKGAGTIWLIASESGASSVTFNVLSFEKSDSLASSAIQTGTISSATPAPIIVEVGLPYIAIQAINQDGANASNLTASFIITWR
jgi:hypothetical protein